MTIIHNHHEVEMNAELLSDDFARQFADAKIVKFPAKVLSKTEKLSDIHRREAAACKQRIADNKRGLKERLSTLQLARKTAKARYETEIAQIAEEESEAREATATAIALDEKLAHYNAVAVEALAE